MHRQYVGSLVNAVVYESYFLEFTDHIWQMVFIERVNRVRTDTFIVNLFDWWANPHRLPSTKVVSTSLTLVLILILTPS